MPQDIVKKIGNHYIVWFKQSNLWVQFEEPAWFVHYQHQKGVDLKTITRKCVKRYNLTQKESYLFVKDIYTSISNLNEPFRDLTTDHNPSLQSSFNCKKHYTTRNYLIGNKCFRILFETRLAEYYIHPTLAHLETTISQNPDVIFEIQNSDNLPVLIEQNEKVHTCKGFMQLKKRLFIRMANTLYNKTNDDWLSFVHASALTDGKKTILLSSASGSGKSTMAALLQTKGLTVVSDDFVPIDAKNKKAFAFPAAISIKEGSFDLLSPYYGNLHDKKFNNYEYINNAVRYLPLRFDIMSNYKERPLKTIVFIQYKPDILCDFKIIPQNEALKLFHEQAWVSPKHTRNFINWFVKLNYYRLEYSDTNEGINKILGIFK